VRRFIIFAVVLSLVHAALAAPRTKPAVKIDSPIVGKWQRVSCNGTPDEKDDVTVLTFDADGTRSMRFSKDPLTKKESVSYGTYRVHPESSPAGIDWIFEPKEPRAKPGYLLGIFEVNGDTMKFTLRQEYSPPESRRPTEFKYSALDTAVEVFQRVKD
jgi:uncharacterized protein (TIGR03067 family)